MHVHTGTGSGVHLTSFYSHAIQVQVPAVSSAAMHSVPAVRLVWLLAIFYNVTTFTVRKTALGVTTVICAMFLPTNTARRFATIHLT